MPPEAPRRRILCVMRMPPDPRGHGGSQRAWHLLQALLTHGEVHFVLIYRDQDKDCVDAPLGHVEAVAASVTRVRIAGWQGAERKANGVLHPWLVDLVRMRSHEAPVFRGSELRAIAAQLPLRDPDVIFAGRLCCAVVIERLIKAGLLAAAPRVVDFDDIMSRFRRLQLAAVGREWGMQGRWLARLDAEVIRRAEDRIAQSWAAVSVCTDEDVAALQARRPAADVVKMPNIVVRPELPARAADGTFKILFAGNLRFRPNVDGLIAFVAQAWPALQAAVPRAALSIVGMHPLPEVQELTRLHGFTLAANVPDMDPYYRDCDVVIAPILFGSGTRIKILEAMAYGRAVVATQMGAEGLGLVDGEHAVLTATVPEFAAALAGLAADPARLDTMAAAARAFQQRQFGPARMSEAVADLLRPVAASVFPPLTA
jgi:glycosyltransferase involved in cell wall biosynthesis